jgi:V8-like Glu-specific endopeptidase
MSLTKKLILALSLAILSCSNVSATMKFLLDEPVRHFFKSRAFHKVSRSFFSEQVRPPYVDDVNDMNRKYINKTLETAIIPKRKPTSYDLPTNFFMEKRDDVIIKNVNERIFHVHRKIKMEKESSIKNEIEEDKQYALFKKKDGRPDDRRVMIKDPLDNQYLPICYLRGSYKLSDKDSLFYVGSGFRNSFNQIVTAGHNLFLEQEDVEKYCEDQKILLYHRSNGNKFSFDKNLLTMQIIFGYRKEQGSFKYTHISEVNGRHCFTHEGRDLGVIKLPVKQKIELDNDIGSLPTRFFPDQPHEYVDKIITIVGYPGEMIEPSLHFHSGPIKSVDPGKVIFYDVDTTKGNSGSPGLDGVENGKDIIPVFLTHTHAVIKSKLNAGQGYDQDFYDFMFRYAN